MYCKRGIFLALILVQSLACVAEPCIVSLQAPYMDETELVVQTACDRPRRSTGINISCEYCGDTCIFHCYGHGGSGYTTLFGSIDQTIALIMHENISLDAPIRVIGSGCMGLLLAVELRRAGFTTVSISTKQRYDIPSWRAGGFFDPGVGTESSLPDLRELMLALSTYHTLHAIEQGKHPYLPASIVARKYIYYPVTINVGVEVLAKLGFMPASEEVTLDFGNGVQHEGYKRQMTYFIDVTALMKQLWQQIDALQIPVVDEEIISFDQCAESVICNCTGLGSRALNNDDAVYPGRGHFYMIKARPDGSQLDYMLFTKVGEKKEWIYFFPKPAFVLDGEEMACAGMLGGTSIACTDMGEDEVAVLDEEQFGRLKMRCRVFFHNDLKVTIFGAPPKPGRE